MTWTYTYINTYKQYNYQGPTYLFGDWGQGTSGGGYWRFFKEIGEYLFIRKSYVVKILLSLSGFRQKTCSFVTVCLFLCFLGKILKNKRKIYTFWEGNKALFWPEKS